MAQKKRKEPEVKEDYNFVPPNFNEREFLEKDIAVTKTFLFSGLIAVLLGAAAYFTTSIHFIIGLILILAGVVALKFIFSVLPIDISSVENKTWIGNGVLTFFLALGIWILLLNPPFGDFVNPQIDDLEAWVGDSEVSLSTLPANVSVIMNVTITDNGALSSVEYEITDLTSNTVLATGELSETDNNRYEFNWTFTDHTTGRNYVVVITAIDDAGNQESEDWSLYVP